MVLLSFVSHSKCRASTRPAGERVTFLTPGILPSAATRPAALFAPLLRRSACAKKGNQTNTPPVARSPGILPCECARLLRGSLDVRPCTFSERAHIVCALFRTFPMHPRRATGGPVCAASCRRSQSECKNQSKSRSRSFSTRTRRGSARMHGFVDPGAVRGAEHRRRSGKCPQGRAHDARASADSTWTYCQTTPPVPRSTGTPRRA